MRIIITGGSGFLGRSLTPKLVAAEHEVVILSRTPEKVTGLPAGARAIQWDGLSTEGWQQIADNTDVILNLAGEGIANGRWTQTRKRLIAESRQHVAKAVVKAVQAATTKPKLVIQASGVGYYGPRGEEKITENSGFGDDFLAQVCVPWEASTAPVEQLGVRRAVTRIGIVLARQGGALPRMLLPFRLFAGGPLGSGRQGFPWVHIEDYTRAVLWLIENEDADGIFNLAAPESLNNAEFSSVLGSALKRPAFLPVPGFALRLLFGEMATLLLDGQMAVPKRLVDMGFRFRYPTAKAALNELLTE